MDLYNWLEVIDKHYEVEDIPLGNRPTKACIEYFLRYGGSMFLPSGFRQLVGTESECEKIKAWYESKYGENALKLPQTGEFLSVFYWNGHFWRINFPYVFGTVNLNPLDSLNMPESTKKEFCLNQDNYNAYMKFWVDCYDYATSKNALKNCTNLKMDGMQFFVAADQGLRKAATHFSNNVNNASIVMDCRNALEKFIKALIGFSIGISEEKARKINHSLEKGFNELISISKFAHLQSLKGELKNYPNYQLHYQELSLPQAKQWECFRFVQTFGAIVVRTYTSSVIR